ncbi:N-acetylmuramidase domain-containing protein [Acinetobacter ursingii]|uniref:N-acetylmuramidase domain-containing protein n=1 Tax=Acinetobacter ursingii TaxID=108980 RepID=UPI00148EF8B7|nr:N-acetylmuramidase family protein [Acinetobacter ursingii]
MILKYGAKGDPVAQLQKKLTGLGFVVQADGDFGHKTETALKAFQKKVGLVSDGIAGTKTWSALNGFDISKFLKDSDYVNGAKRLGVPELVLRAFSEVESDGGGYLDNGKLEILFERHRMYFYLAQYKGVQFAKQQMQRYPNIVNTATGGYKGKAAEHTRLSLAKQIHEQAALESTSWGQFQLMGENWKDLGYESVQDFVAQMQKSESLQFEAFLRFVEFKSGTIGNKKIKLLDALRAEDWVTVFTLYNGKNYKKLGYDSKFIQVMNRLDPDYLNGKAA